MKFIMGFMVALAFVAVGPISVRNYRLREDLRILTAINEDLKERCIMLRADNTAFNRSQQYQERVVRDVLGYQKEKDLTIIFD